MPQISKKIIDFLEGGKAKYEIIEHRTAYTAKDRAATNLKNKIKPDEIVKALVMKADSDYFIALVPSNKMLDKNKLKKVVNMARKQDPDTKSCKKIDFAKEAWMKKNILGKIGAVPPFSEMIKTPIFADGALLRQKQLYLGSGEYEFSIKMTPAQYQKLEKDLEKGSFSKTR